MAVLPWLRAFVFSFASLLALVVIGICAHIESFVAGYQNAYLTFAALGLAAGSLTVLSLPLFLIVGRVRRGAVMSMVVFEAVWFFFLWVTWVATAVSTVAGRAYYFPDGCIYTNYPQTNQICYEVTIMEAAAFIIFFCVFIYYVTIVFEASGPAPTSLMPMAQYSAIPGGQAPYPAYGSYPQNASQPYSRPYSQSYNTYPAQPPNQQYYNYPPLGSPASGNTQPPHGGYLPAISGNAPLSPQPDYGSYPANQGQIPPSGGYQE
ncbi:uncharacterized protein EDB91DRAFT_1292013 [Suillus paluster]|uniref:uncharacterized protein n=1 Tax=Suillus paluster TaxID=48578 RepID=UPI001B865E8C|nr:uncharacterized protein EDB91DRAFT_1292013 [Suillus paluster]KAG1736422.1 hypothetical protein EDB91DRAFT_1292013 [Suillus paluster]